MFGFLYKPQTPCFIYPQVYNPTMKKPLTFYTIILLFLVSLIHSLTGCDSSLREKQINEIESYKQAVKIDPDYAEAHFNLGDTYDETGKYEEAIESYKQAVRINPDYAEAHYYLGVAYIDLNDEEELNEKLRDSALEQYEILKSLDPERANELFDKIYE